MPSEFKNKVYFLINKKLWLGLGYRTGDALIGMVGFGFGLTRVLISYDGTISDFQVANQGRGGVELSFSHIIQKIKPVRPGRPCPIF